MAVSRALPGWTAEEIHRALNEVTLSEDTAQVLHRVGTAMGEAQGRGPDDDPCQRRQRRESREAGYAEGRERGRTAGYAEGQAKGLDEGRKEGLRAAVLQVLESRGISVSVSFPERLAAMEPASIAALVRVAMECRDERDFLRLVRRRSPPGTRNDGALIRIDHRSIVASPPRAARPTNAQRLPIVFHGQGFSASHTRTSASPPVSARTADSGIAWSRCPPSAS